MPPIGTASEILAELRQDLGPANPTRLEYTRKAYRMLPGIDQPRILDVGCGRGDPTLELANLSEGEIIGVDIDQPSLDELERRIEAAGLSDRARVLNRSLFDLGFPDASFDIIWAEGVIWRIGFEKGLETWHRFIKPQGYLVVHEMTWLSPDPPQEIADHLATMYPGIRTGPEYIQCIPGCGYQLIGHFPLPGDVWWLDYFGPLETRIGELHHKYAGDRAAQQVLDAQQREVDLFQQYKKWYGSAFYAMQKST